jgi:protein-tyrosine phosphatase
MLMNWSSPFIEEKKKKKITNPKQLEQIEDDLMDYTPPKEKKEPENVYEMPLFEYQKPPDSALIEKLNYMIYLLEEQRDEKTSQITEELILYVFLGVFTLFVLDSFVKHGKYTR